MSVRTIWGWLGWDGLFSSKSCQQSTARPPRAWLSHYAGYVILSPDALPSPHLSSALSISSLDVVWCVCVCVCVYVARHNKLARCLHRGNAEHIPRDLAQVATLRSRSRLLGDHMRLCLVGTRRNEGAIARAHRQPLAQPAFLAPEPSGTMNRRGPGRGKP